MMSFIESEYARVGVASRKNGADGMVWESSGQFSPLLDGDKVLQAGFQFLGLLFVTDDGEGDQSALRLAVAYSAGVLAEVQQVQIGAQIGPAHGGRSVNHLLKESLVLLGVVKAAQSRQGVVQVGQA